MSPAIRQDTTFGKRRQVDWRVVFVMLCALLVIGFVAAPGSLEGRALAVLHGLCAQQPTHTFYFGDARLPFDARMTGIYGGFASAALAMLALGRWRAGLIPPVPLLLLLAGFTFALGIDGVNSTLVDLNRRHFYEPSNIVRLVTGLLTGVTLAVFVWMLVCQVAFARVARRPEPPLRGVRDLFVVLGVQVAFATGVLSGWPWLRPALTLLLITAAVAALMGLSLAFILLLTRREYRALRTGDLAGPATAALLIALLVIAVTSGGRFLLEATLQITPAG